jgi:hypothetical protein
MVKRSKKSKRSKGRLRRGATLRSRPRVDRFRAAHPLPLYNPITEHLATLQKANSETESDKDIEQKIAELIRLAKESRYNYVAIVRALYPFTIISSMLEKDRLRTQGVLLLHEILRNVHFDLVFPPELKTKICETVKSMNLGERTIDDLQTRQRIFDILLSVDTVLRGTPPLIRALERPK